MADYIPTVWSTGDTITVSLANHWEQQYNMAKKEYEDGNWQLHPDAESKTGATEKANQAESNAKDYTDQHIKDDSIHLNEENIEDIISTLLSTGENMELSYDDANNKLIIKLNTTSNGFGGLIYSGIDGVTELGRYLDLHYSESSDDYSVRFEVDSENSINITGIGDDFKIGGKRVLTMEDKDDFLTTDKQDIISKDWNKIINPGMYNVSTSEKTNPDLNQPDNEYGWGLLLVIKDARNHGMTQIYFPHHATSGANNIWIRTGYNQNWDEWTKLITSNNTTLENVYPVGSIYMNANTNQNPATLLGFGSWEPFGAGRVLVGVNPNDGSFNTVRKTGGEKAHTLNESEIPNHNHNIGEGGNHGHGGKVYSGGEHRHEIDARQEAADTWGSKTLSGAGLNSGFTGNTSYSGTHSHTLDIYNSGNHSHSCGGTGGGEAHNNLQPYITVYMWRRTA